MFRYLLLRLLHAGLGRARHLLSAGEQNAVSENDAYESSDHVRLLFRNAQDRPQPGGLREGYMVGQIPFGWLAQPGWPGPAWALSRPL